MKTHLTLVGMTVALMIASPALAQEQETLRSAASQPLRDLSIVRQETPDALLKAAADPYASAGGNCAAMRQEIAQLDTVLGDDLGDVSASKGTLVTDAVKSAVSLPFGGVIRRITGAHKRDKAYQEAVIAGVARRAFLKGGLDACMTTPPPVISAVNAKPVRGKRIPLVPTTPPIIAESRTKLTASR